MVRKYIKLNKNYSLLIQEVCEAYNADYLLMYSILIFEDFNRPWFIRFIENTIVRFLHIHMTVGIAQIRSDRPLSNVESITLLVQRLKETKQANLEQKVAALTTYGNS